MSDGQLLGRFIADRDESAEAAFAALVRRHGPMVLRVCGQILGDRHGAEDAFQATFLVLARKSGSIRRPELLGNWLYGVALRTAREARMREGRRRQRRDPGGRGRPPGTGRRSRAGPRSALICREEFEALHEEVSRLPERYRIPVVLCELEGLTYQEVARRMRCPVGTIGVRLARARERLRVRLIRRGIVPAAALTEPIFGAGGASAPDVAGAGRLHGPGRLGLRGERRRGDGLVSAAVVALTEAVLRTMSLARLKVATGVVLVVGLTAAVGWVGGHRPAWSRLLDREGPSPGGSGTAPRPSPPDRRRSRAPAVRRRRPPRALRPALEPDRPAAGGSSRSRRSGARAGRSPVPALASRSATGPRGADARRGPVLQGVGRERPREPRTATGWGRSTTRPRAWPATAWGPPAAPGRRARTSSSSRRSRPTAGPCPRGLEKIHPGFRGTRSTVLHRYGTDPAYGSWRRRFFEADREKAQVAPEEAGEETVEARIRRIAEQTAPNRPGSSNARRASRRRRRHPEGLRAEHPGAVRGGPDRLDPVRGPDRGGRRAARRGPGPGRPRTARAGSAGSAGRRRSPASTSSSGSPAPASSAWRSPAIRRRSRRSPRTRRPRGST